MHKYILLLILSAFMVTGCQVDFSHSTPASKMMVNTPEILQGPDGFYYFDSDNQSLQYYDLTSQSAVVE